MNFNTDPNLWANYFRVNPDANMRYFDGAVYDTAKPKSGCLAMFSTNEDAIRCMTIARELSKS